MKKMMGAGALFFMLICSSANAAEEIARFDFQQVKSDMQYDFYRIEADIANQKGEMCYFNSIGQELSNDAIYGLTGNEIWSRIPDLAKYKRTCVKFDIYGSSGWFFTPSFKYTVADYRFFFIGDINEKQMKGTLYQFRMFQAPGEKKNYRVAEEFKISVPAGTK